jgi:hypothetical protein
MNGPLNVKLDITSFQIKYGMCIRNKTTLSKIKG